MHLILRQMTCGTLDLSRFLFPGPHARTNFDFPLPTYGAFPKINLLDFQAQLQRVLHLPGVDLTTLLLCLKHKFGFQGINCFCFLLLPTRQCHPWNHRALQPKLSLPKLVMFHLRFVVFQVPILCAFITKFQSPSFKGLRVGWMMTQR